jgi:hypothetical protein
MDDSSGHKGISKLNFWAFVTCFSPYESGVLTKRPCSNTSEKAAGVGSGLTRGLGQTDIRELDVPTGRRETRRDGGLIRRLHGPKAIGLSDELLRAHLDNQINEKEVNVMQCTFTE